MLSLLTVMGSRLLADDVALVIDSNIDAGAVFDGFAAPDLLIVELQIRDIGIAVGLQPLAGLGLGETVGAGNRGRLSLRLQPRRRNGRRVSW